MKYKHTQVGYVIVSSFIVLFAFVFMMTKTATATEVTWALNTVTYVFLLFILLFCCLTVSIDEKYLTAVFGIGFIRKKVLLFDIKSVEAVKNKWYYGWGIRFLGSEGWMFNISGLDAVKLELKNGKKFRIGTNEPEALIAALKPLIK